MADRVALLKLEIQGINQADELKNKLKTLKKGTDEYNLTLKQLNDTEAQLSKTRSKLIKSTDDLIGNNKKGLTGVSQAAGASTSATLELGRVLSDMPYGIRGVANNLQQLASNLFFMSKATDAATGKSVGFMGAIKNLLGGLIGPAGILIAFQGIIALFDFFSQGAKKAEKSTKDFRESVGSAAVALKSLKIVVDNNMLSKKELADVVGKVNEKYKDLNIELDKEGQLTKESIKQIDNKILALEDLAKANAMMSVIEEKHTEIIRAQLKLQEDTSKRLEDIGAKDLEDFKQNKDELIKVQEGYYKGAIDADKLATKARIQGSIDTFNTEKSKIESEIKELLKLSTDSGFFDDFFNGKKKSKGSGKSKFSPFKTQKELDLDVKNQENAIIRLNKTLELQELSNLEKTEIFYAKTEEDKNHIKKRYAKKRLEIQYDAEKKSLELSRDTEIAVAKEKTKNHVAQLRRNFEEFEQKVKQRVALKELSQKDADSLIGKAAGEIFDKSIQADTELKSTVEGIIEAYNPLFSVLEELYDERRDALGIGESKDSEMASLEQYLEQVKQLMSSVSNFISAEYDRQLTIEANHTAKLNEQLNNRLLNEKLSANERKNIQNQIAINDEALRKKQNAIKKKQFDTNKAFNISTALIDTYLAASKAFKTYGGFPTGIAPMALSVAKGLANVAMIARQKFQPDAASTPVRASIGGGAGGDGVGDRSFNFNLVGNTLGNQITDAIQGQFDQPLKAYVVSRDITNQQALDANIKGTASF